MNLTNLNRKRCLKSKDSVSFGLAVDDTSIYVVYDTNYATQTPLSLLL